MLMEIPGVWERWRGLVRLLKYAGVGIPTFVLDLGILYVLTDILHIHYVVSASAAFIIAFSLNYHLSRKYVFSETLRSMRAGYAIFLCVGGSGLFLIAGLMYLCVDIAGMDYMVSRILIASLIGLWNYYINLYVTFRVAESQMAPSGSVSAQ